MRVLVPLVLVLLLVGCKLNTDYFGEYRDVNLLSNYDLDAKESDGTAKWTTSTLGRNASAGSDSYMTWEKATDLNALALDVGPDGKSAAYRLEIKNLVPNGDFEASVDAALSTSLPASLTTPGWATYVGAPMYALSTAHADNGQASPTALASATVDHRSLLFSSQGAGQRLGLSLATALGTSLWQEGMYRVRVDFVNVSTLTSVGFWLFPDASSGTSTQAGLDQFQADDSGVWTQRSLATVTNPTRTELSKTFTISSASDVRVLTIGMTDSGSTDAALIDNVRVLPADLDLSAVASFPSLSSGSLKLLPGTKSGAYVFTLRVHDDPSADQTGGSGVSHTNNRFYPDGLTIAIRGRAKNAPNTILALEFIPRPTGGWTSWTTITLNGGLDFVDNDSELEEASALSISLTPTNGVDVTTGGRNVGSLLVSQPTLTFNP